jgi:hypothetical protein
MYQCAPGLIERSDPPRGCRHDAGAMACLSFALGARVAARMNWKVLVASMAGIAGYIAAACGPLSGIPTEPPSHSQSPVPDPPNLPVDATGDCRCSRRDTLGRMKRHRALPR